MHTK
jgi:hypothetical protein